MIGTETWLVPPEGSAMIPAMDTPRRPDRCRLTLTINGVHFLVRPIRSEDENVRRAFGLRRRGVVFDVAVTVHGPVCDCPDFIFRQDGLDPRKCIHMPAMRAVGLS
jgi:hypothetical protein